MGSNFQMPEFNFRLRRALNPFESNISPRSSAPKKNLFSSVGDTFANNAGWGDEEEEEEDEGLPPFSRAMPDFSSLYDKTGPATQRYQSHLGEVPALKDYAPTKWRRLGAVLAGAGAALGGKDGYSKAREIVMDPYQTAYGDWEGRGAGLKESAVLEENATAKKATLHQKILSDFMDSQDKGFDRQVRWGTLENQRDQTKIQQARAEIEAERVAGQITNAEALAKLRRLAIETAASTARRGQDMSKDTAEQRIFSDSVRGAYDRNSREKVAGMYVGSRGDSGINATEQQKIKDNAIFALSRKYGQDEVEKYIDLETGLVTNPAMPLDMMQEFERAMEAGRQMTNPRYGR